MSYYIDEDRTGFFLHGDGWGNRGKRGAWGGPGRCGISKPIGGGFKHVLFFTP